MAAGLDHEYYAYLASRIRQGDNDAFRELYDATYDTLHRYVTYFLKDPELIQDAMQEIYISVFRGIPALRKDNLVYPWMKQIAYHTCCNVLRQVQKSREYQTEMPEDRELAALAGGDCFQPVYDRDVSRELDEALGDLPLNMRQAFVLRYEYDLKLEEIADFMGASLSSVKRYIASARNILQKKLAHMQTTL